jgi:hypothetical protein
MNAPSALNLAPIGASSLAMAKKAARSPGADGNPANPGKAAAAAVAAMTDAFCRE